MVDTFSNGSAQNPPQPDKRPKRKRLRQQSTREAREYVLEAADTFGRPFSEEELIVGAWRLAPREFGLAGFEELYPDARKMLLCLNGRRGLIVEGVLAKGPDGMIVVAEKP